MKIRDDAGRLIRIRGKATLIDHVLSFQEFALTGVTLGKAKYGRHVTSLFLGMFSGSDWAHWYDDGFVCSAPELTIEACVGQWLLN